MKTNRLEGCKIKEDSYTINEVINLLGVGKSTLFLMISQGRFPKAIKIKGVNLWPKNFIHEFLKKRDDRVRDFNIEYKGSLPKNKIRERKIIQIATGIIQRWERDRHGDNLHGYQDTHILYALCDDGTLWRKDYGRNIWVKNESIPQPEENPTITALRSKIKDLKTDLVEKAKILKEESGKDIES